MPSTNQKAGEQTDYDTEAARMIAEKPKPVLLSIKPMTEKHARTWLGAANADGDRELIEHFAEEVRRQA